MKDNCDLLNGSISSLARWIDAEGPYGWDPYDALNGPLNVRLHNHYSRVIMIQLNKYSPINLRYLFGVKKGIDLKGVSILAQAYSKMYLIAPDTSLRQKIKILLDYIISNSLIDRYGYDCWSSHYFPYVAIDRNTLDKCSPDIIGTCQSINALILGYQILHDKEYYDCALNASNFLIDVLYKINNNFSFFKYATSETIEEIVPNASAHALEAIASILKIENKTNLINTCAEVFWSLIKIQNTDGSWVYSMYPDGELKRKQLDYHQGYMIDGLKSFIPFVNDNGDAKHCISLAAEFYKNKLFHKNGSSYFRYPLAHPIDIHNQAQGIITFSKLGKCDSNYLYFANKISNWTITNMHDPSGFFYYQKWPLITNKTPHMRWGQAWMLLAEATLLGTLNGGLR